MSLTRLAAIGALVGCGAGYRRVLTTDELASLDILVDSACIAVTNYCFRTCASKPECNANRDPVNEANCSSTATFVDGTMNRKACVPPS